jgi:hypothetical protein
MTYPKKMKLEVQIEVDMPLDILLKINIDLEDGLVHCISKGLYEEGVSFRINTVTFKT